MSPRERLIRQLAVKYGLDPEAVVSIASVEGQSALHGGTSIGDHGTSFGPFQLHAGGALPRGKSSAWAHSRAGIDYALRSMSQVAGGLKGQAAVSAISSRFERPADVPGEIAKAMTYYGKGGSTPPGTLPPGPAGAPGANGGDSGAVQALSAQSLKAMYTSALLQPGGPNSTDLLSMAIARKQADAAAQQFPGGAQGPLVPRPASAKTNAGINELFYDPLGGMKNGREIGAIGHHSDHVHISLSNGNAQLQAIAQAQHMGMHVGEERGSDVHPVHATDSYHYRTYGKQFGNLREAADVSGTPQQMAAYYRWVQHSFG